MERRLNYEYQPTWETTEQNDPFESALSSTVSSPTGERSNGGDFILGGCDHGMMMELIGRLGCMYESTTANNSTNTSCYTTPLNSPPKVSSISSYMLMAGGGSGGGVNLPNFHADPGFVERAAKFSSFGLNRGGGGGGVRSGVNLECGKLSGSSLNHGDVGDSREGSSVSEQNHVGQMGLIDGNSRKRKSFSKSKAKDNDNKVEQENEKSNAKRSKANYEEGKKQNGGECNYNNNNNSKEVAKAEPAKDYIHVRARRGQATDSHSLAERVRREKISERMKFLQDLVPGCNKVIGKATVLDEIINYVQSLQHQVEFLSMKLATLNPRIEFNPENLVSKHMFESKGSSTMPQIMYKLEQTSAQAFTHTYQPFQHLPNGNEHPFSTNPSIVAGIRPHPPIQFTSSITGFGDSITQMPNFCENDLQSIVPMGILQNQTQSLPGTSPNAPMKVEL